MIRHRQPFRCPLPDLRPVVSRSQAPARYAVPRTTLPEAEWPAIIARAEHEGTRPIARDLGVSHEAVRSVLRAAGRADLLQDMSRRQRLAATAPPPPPPTRTIPVEQHPEVRRRCERHTQAEVAAVFGVSQNMIWRILHGRRH
jgi:hypothetical protein